MGKHVLIEIPMGMSLAESERLAALEAQAGGRLVCMVCHSQRYSRGFREIKRRLARRELTLHHIVQQTYFLRRKNENRFGNTQKSHMFALFDLPRKLWIMRGTLGCGPPR